MRGRSGNLEKRIKCHRSTPFASISRRTATHPSLLKNTPPQVFSFQKHTVLQLLRIKYLTKNLSIYREIKRARRPLRSDSQRVPNSNIHFHTTRSRVNHLSYSRTGSGPPGTADPPGSQAHCSGRWRPGDPPDDPPPRTPRAFRTVTSIFIHPI